MLNLCKIFQTYNIIEYIRQSFCRSIWFWWERKKIRIINIWLLSNLCSLYWQRGYLHFFIRNIKFQQKKRFSCSKLLFCLQVSLYLTNINIYKLQNARRTNIFFWIFKNRVVRRIRFLQFKHHFRNNKNGSSHTVDDQFKGYLSQLNIPLKRSLF